MELVNASNYFQKLSCGEEYGRPRDEAHGQPDANSKQYCIDFKLLVANSMMEGKSILTDSITKIGVGAYAIGEPKARDKKRMKCTNICQAIRNYSLENLERIENQSNRSFVDKDIAIFLRPLKTQKNILLFYPYRFDFAEEYLETDAVNEVMKVLHRDLKAPLSYRQKYADGFDTYISTVYRNKFVIFKMSVSSYEYVDNVDASKIKTFENLMQIGSY